MTTNSSSDRTRRGQATVEFALLLPFLLVLMGLLFELGRFAIIRQNCVNISRESMLQAARRVDPPTTTNFPNVIKSAIAMARPINLTNDGRIYIGQVFRDNDNQPRIVQYQAFGNFTAPAKVLSAGLGGLAALSPEASACLTSNDSLYVVETYLRFVPVMSYSFPGLSSVIPPTNRVYVSAFL